jgi:hypothetical protein
MKSFFVRFLVVSLLIVKTGSSLLAQKNEPASTPTQPIELFDGKSLSGWTFVSKGTNGEAASIWSVQDGVIACLGKPNGYARTLKSYRDYQLHVEWRFPAGAGNSGLFLHLNPPDQVWPLCYEAQLQSGNAGELRLNGGARIDGLANPNAKSLPHQQPVSEKPVGEWNVCDVVCRSNSISIRINGVLQNEITGAAVGSGAIGLQAEGKPVQFRNVRLDPLPKL